MKLIFAFFILVHFTGYAQSLLPAPATIDTFIYRSRKTLCIIQPKGDSAHAVWFTESGKVMGQATITNDINKFVFVNEEPFPLNMEELKKKLSLPKQKNGKLINGEIVVRVYVSKTGSVESIIPILADHEALIPHISVLVKDLVFSPAKKGDSTCGYWVNVPFIFGKKRKELYPALHPGGIHQLPPPPPPALNQQESVPAGGNPR